jgi:multidrug efflux system membrane fusion protein
MGKLVFLDNSVQTGTGTIKLRAELPNSDRYFWPGQFVNVRLILTTKHDAVLIPAQALQIGQQGPYVYVVKDQVAQIRPVRPGQRQGDLLTIDEGVAAGENVITAGQLMVIPGKPVRLIDATTQPVAQVEK